MNTGVVSDGRRKPINGTVNLILMDGRWRQDGDWFERGPLGDLRAKPMGLREFRVCDNPGAMAKTECALLERLGSKIFISENEVLLAVDVARTLPIFFSLQGDVLWISDTASCIKSRIPARPADPLVRLQFKFTSYVIGGRTLHPDIRQVQSGEVLRLTFSEGSWVCERQGRQIFRPCDKASADEKALLRDYDKVLVTLFEEFLVGIKGRQLIIPLSGGYDSRLIALLVRQAGYQNVLCYTYGRPEHPEVATSRAVAADLGFSWHWIETDTARWRQWSLTEEWARWFGGAGNGCSIPCMQEWGPLYELKKRGVLAQDAIIMPGHCADPLAGSRVSTLPRRMLDSGMSKEELKESIILHHFRLWPMAALSAVERQALVQLLDESVEDLRMGQSWLATFDSWNVAERLSKLIANSGRDFEFFGYNWWMPFWEGPFVHFWERVPMSLRMAERLHIRYINELYQRLLGKEAPLTTKGLRESPATLQFRSWMRSKVRPAMALFRGIPGFSRLEVFRRRALARQDYHQDLWGFSGILNETDFVDCAGKGATTDGIIAAVCLGEITTDWSNRLPVTRREPGVLERGDLERFS